ncbi:MAG: hypothetical protein HY064_06090 [Bacteroidetes bacterium]|nr:hypothetical protein [Bacteroidota bacterium]
MALTLDIQNKIRELSNKIRDNQATAQEYAEYEHLLVTSGASLDQIEATLKQSGFKSWGDYAKARKDATSLEEKRKIQESLVIGGLIGLGLGVLVGLISKEK